MPEAMVREDQAIAEVVKKLATSQQEQVPERPEQGQADPDAGEDSGLLGQAPAGEEAEESDAPEQPEAEEEAEPGAEETREVSNLLELAESLNLDLEKVYGLKVPISDEGEPISLGDLKDNYQTYLQTVKRQKEVEDERQRLSTWRQEQEKQYQAHLGQAVGVLESQKKALETEYSSIDWKSLRESDPAEYAAQQSDFQSRWQSLQTTYFGLQQQEQQRQEKIRQEQQKLFQEQMQQGAKILSEKIPEWSDKEIQKSEIQEIRALAGEYGYSEDELKYVVDPRWVLMWRRLMKLEKIQKQADKATKVVKKLPPMRPPKGPTPPGETNKAKLKALREQARAGDENAAIAAIKMVLSRSKQNGIR